MTGSSSSHAASRASDARFWLRVALRKAGLARTPIRIVFLAQDPLDWYSLDSVYAACAADPSFEATVVHVGWQGEAGGFPSTDCSELFRGKGIPYRDGLAAGFRLESLAPDLVALSSPYDQFRPAAYAASALRRFAKLIYVPYCIDYADRKGESAPHTWGSETHRSAWRIFSRSARTIEQYRRFGGILSSRIVCVGQPRIDQYHAQPSSGGLPIALEEASAGKFKIIYAPHHSVHGWSTFLRDFEAIRRFVDDHADCYLVFRPHPLLGRSLANLGLMTPEAFRGAFDGERCRLYEGTDYYALFRWSDLLVSDASSFLVEYAPTHKPIVYTHREDGRRGLDDSLEEDVFGSCYVSRSAEETIEYVRRIEGGADPLAGQRERFQEKMCVGIFTAGAGKRVAAYLRTTLA